METRQYDHQTEKEALWQLKHAFEQELGKADEEKFSKYKDKLTSEYKERYFSWVERCIEDNRDCIRVLLVEDRLEGYIFVLPERLAMIWDGAVLNELYVTPEHRGSGGAQKLLEDALRIARTQSLPMNRLILDVDPDNGRARNFYQKHGFSPWGEMLSRQL
jgi:GNAT superfamily N-acetyltransferase